MLIYGEKLLSRFVRFSRQEVSPAIHVTHDPTEAEIIGDRVVHWNELQPGDDDEE